MVVHVNGKNFESEVLQSLTPVLVDFWAPWCGPCKMIGPSIDELGKELDGKIKVCKLNVDEAQEIAVQFGVMSIPALLLFKQGKVVTQTIGALPKKEIENFIKKNV